MNFIIIFFCIVSIIIYLYLSPIHVAVLVLVIVGKSAL